jgi:hypothetical protein
LTLAQDSGDGRQFADLEQIFLGNR